MPEDINRDGIVDFVDFAIMMSQWQNINTVPCSITLLTDGFEHGEWNGLWTQDTQRDWYISNINVAEDFLVYLVGRVLEERRQEFEVLERSINTMVATLKATIEQQQHSEMELRQSEQKYRTLFEASSEGFFLMTDVTEAS
jgi:PAS domain-containing protein